MPKKYSISNKELMTWKKEDLVQLIRKLELKCATARKAEFGYSNTQLHMANFFLVGMRDHLLKHQDQDPEARHRLTAYGIAIDVIDRIFKASEEHNDMVVMGEDK